MPFLNDDYDYYYDDLVASKSPVTPKPEIFQPSPRFFCLHFFLKTKSADLCLQKLYCLFTFFRWPMETEVERFTVADVYNPPATTTWKPPTFIKQSFEKPTNPFNFETIREDSSRIR